MAKKMKQLAGVFLLLTLAITFGTLAYHLGMRLCVGTIVDSLFGCRCGIIVRAYGA